MNYSIKTIEYRIVYKQASKTFSKKLSKHTLKIQSPRLQGEFSLNVSNVAKSLFKKKCLYVLPKG